MVETLVSDAGGAGFIPGRGSKIPHARNCGRKGKKKKKNIEEAIYSMEKAL